MKIKEQITFIFDMPEDFLDMQAFEKQNVIGEWYKQETSRSISFTRSTYHLLLKEEHRDND